jgi:large subunit ribosomal protein L18
MITKSRSARLERIKKHIRKNVRGTTERPRLSVYRSLKHLYVQVIDDSQMKTITSVSTLSQDIKEKVDATKNKKELAKIVGQAVAQKVLQKNIKRVVFDRNGYLYHGVVKVLADSAREAGLEF